MHLRDIISVKGTPGLFKLLKVTRGGLLLETLDKDKKKVIKNINFSKATPLDNIAIYSKTNISAVPILDVFLKMNSSKVDLKNITNKTSNEHVQELMKSIYPDYDEDKLYPSQIIKIINWYKIIKEFYTEILKTKEPKKTNKKEENDENKDNTLENEKNDPSVEFTHPKEPINEINHKVSPKNLSKTPVEKDNHKKKK